jgi:dethiobiotin synthetase
VNSRIIFVTGTDTGVGKTLLTGLLLQHLRQRGVHALAIKPFCSGARTDIEILRELQQRELTEVEITPFYFDVPLAPLIAGRQKRRGVQLPRVVEHVEAMADRCKCLLVEGSGGLLVPLGEGYSVADLIDRLECDVVVVGWNRLGTINHTLLTVSWLQRIVDQKLSVVLMQPRKADLSSRTNLGILGELLAPIPVLGVPFLGEKVLKTRGMKKNARELKITLARLVA